MYLHLGQDTVVTVETVIGIFDIDECTVSKKQGTILLPPKKTAMLSMFLMNCQNPLLSAKKKVK